MADWLKPVRHLAARLDDYLNDPSPIIRSGDYSAPVPQPTRERPPEDPDTQLYGATGTPIISGFLEDLTEYNAELRGRNALPVYEKMRRSDADVAAVLSACKLPIRSAEYRIIPGAKDNEPDFALAKEIADFVADCLFGGLEYESALGVKFSQRFESVIENALLCLDFGCSGYEDLWAIDGDRVRLRRLAPRLPLTYYRFHVDDDGETLRAIEQWGYRGQTWVNAAVPANKFTLFSVRQEGSNFYGRGILREAYQHWYVKNALYRIDSIACERNGAGIPTITMAENPAQQDRETGLAWVTHIAQNENTGLLLPYGWDFKLVGVQGTEHKLAPSIQHHSEMIARSALAMFLTLGTTQTGSRALGNTMVDFFQLSEETTAKFICDTISETTIRRLTDFNFQRNGKPLPYPRLVTPHIAVLNPLEIISALKEVASAQVDILQPDDETENWIRTKLGMPQKAGASRLRYMPTDTRIMQVVQGEPGAQPTLDPEKIQQDPGDVERQRKAQKIKALPAPKKELAEAALLSRALEGRRKWHGLDISIETDAGSTRSGTDANGKPWSVTMQYPYGYIRRTEAADGEHVDCYLGPDEDAEYVYVIHQNKIGSNGNSGAYDEDKCMLNFPDAATAKDAYFAHHSEGRRIFDAMEILTVQQFIERALATKKDPGKIELAELMRPLKPHEQKHDFAGHAKRQDATATAIRRLLGPTADRLRKVAARRAADLGPTHLDTFALPFDRSLAAQIAESTKRAYRYGYTQVYAERYRATKKPRHETPKRLSDSAVEDQPTLIAEAAVADLNNAITARARGAAIDAYKRGLRAQELEDAILDDLEESATGYLDRIAMEAARSGVAGGRWSAFQELAAEIDRYARSEAMDQNTCGPCAEGDGQEWDSLDEVDWSPGDDCDGADACRGQLMPIFADEGTVEELHERHPVNVTVPETKVEVRAAIMERGDVEAIRQGVSGDIAERLGETIDRSNDKILAAVDSLTERNQQAVEAVADAVTALQRKRIITKIVHRDKDGRITHVTETED